MTPDGREDHRAYLKRADELGLDVTDRRTPEAGPEPGTDDAALLNEIMHIMDPANWHGRKPESFFIAAAIRTRVIVPRVAAARACPSCGAAGVCSSCGKPL